MIKDLLTIYIHTIPFVFSFWAAKVSIDKCYELNGNYPLWKGFARIFCYVALSVVAISPAYFLGKWLGY